MFLLECFLQSKCFYSEIVTALKSVQLDNNEPQFVCQYLSSESVILPPLKYRYQGPNWTNKNARETLTKYFALLGFGNSGSKKFMQKNDEPAFWPENIIDFEFFQHPSRAKTGTINKIMEAMFSFYNYDINTHCIETATVEPQRKKKRTRARKEPQPQFLVDEDTDQELSNSLVDIVQGNVPDQEPSQPILLPEASIEMSEYEKIREKNIQERNECLREIGLL